MVEHSTFVLLLWVHEQDHEDQLQPAAILGPFTMAQAEQTRLTLVCHSERRRITTEVPEWAMTEEDLTP